MRITQEVATLRAMVADLQRRVPANSGRQKSRSNTFFVTQTAHGLAVRDVIQYGGTYWSKPIANTPTSAALAIAMVVAVISPNVFEAATDGYITGLSGLTPGSIHYLHPITAGSLTTAKPVYAAPVIFADSTTSGVLMGRQLIPRIVNGISIPLTTLINSSTPGSSSVSAPADGIIYGSAMGGGGGGGRGGNQAILGYIASSSGGSPTVPLYKAHAGAGGGHGAVIRFAMAVASGDSISYTVPAGGARGVSALSAGATGGSAIVTVGSISMTALGGRGGGLSGGYDRGGGGQSTYDNSIAYNGTPAYLTLSFDPGPGGGDAPLFVGASGTTLAGGLGAGYRDTSSSPGTGQGGSGEDFVVGTGGANNGQAGGSGAVIVYFQEST